MTIEKMNYSDLNKIAELDKECFNRKEKKTKARIEELFIIGNDCSFVVKENDIIIAYLFTHVFGNIASIGPIGVSPNLQRQGIGRQLVNYTIEHLRNKGINKIYLEVLPDKLYNIGFYSRMGFRLVKPTIQYGTNNMTNPLSNRYKYIDGNEIDKNELYELLKRISIVTKGVSFELDLSRVIENDPHQVLFIYDKAKIVGFLCYYEKMYDYVFGYIEQTVSVYEALYTFCNYIKKRTKRESLSLRINPSDLMLDCKTIKHLTVEKVLLRMELCEKLSDKGTPCGIIRSYIG